MCSGQWPEAVRGPTCAPTTPLRRLCTGVPGVGEGGEGRGGGEGKEA